VNSNVFYQNEILKNQSHHPFPSVPTSPGLIEEISSLLLGKFEWGTSSTVIENQYFLKFRKKIPSEWMIVSEEAGIIRIVPKSCAWCEVHPMVLTKELEQSAAEVPFMSEERSLKDKHELIIEMLAIFSSKSWFVNKEIICMEIILEVIDCIVETSENIQEYEFLDRSALVEMKRASETRAGEYIIFSNHENTWIASRVMPRSEDDENIVTRELDTCIKVPLKKEDHVFVIY